MLSILGRKPLAVSRLCLALFMAVPVWGSALAAPQGFPAVTSDPGALKIDQDLRALKDETLRLNRELQAVERALLYPNHSLTTFYVSVKVDGFLLDRISIRVNENEAIRHVYSGSDALALLEEDGWHRLVRLSLAPGRYRVRAEFQGHFFDARPGELSVTGKVETQIEKGSSELNLVLPISGDTPRGEIPRTGRKVSLSPPEQVEAAVGAGAPGSLKDPRYRAALFLKQAGRLLSALTELLEIEQSAPDSVALSTDFYFFMAECYLGFGMEEQASMLYQRIASGPHDALTLARAGLQLAQFDYQRGYFGQAIERLQRLRESLPASLLNDGRLLLASALLAVNRYDETIEVLTQGGKVEELPPALRYNLAVAMIHNGRIKEGRQQLNQVGTIDAGTPDLRALRDKANLILGYQYLQEQQGDSARAVFDRIRVTGSFSNRALLGLGWTEIAPASATGMGEAADSAGSPYNDDSLGAFFRARKEAQHSADLQAMGPPTENQEALTLALIPWIELVKRDPMDPAVQEGMLAIPWALDRLRSYEPSLARYLDAVAGLETARRRMDEAMLSIKNGRMVETIVRADMDLERGWTWRLRDLPDAPETYFLQNLLAEHPFQESLKNYLDARLLTRNLKSWSQRLDALHPREDHLPQLRALRARVEALQPQPGVAGAAQGRLLEAVSTRELGGQKKVIERYLTEARFAVARIYERKLKDGQIAEDAAAANLPPANSGPIKSTLTLALENYEELLKLPQEPGRRLETMRRVADLQLEADEAGGASLQESNRRLRRSIEIYNAVLAEQPQAPGNDRVLYQIARAHQNLGEIPKASDVLQRLTHEFPKSSYSDDGHFRRAELLFREGLYEEAATEYRHVLAADTSPFFEPAQYKYGWTQYRQSNYEAAVEAFLGILSRLLPSGPQSDVETALDGVGRGKKDMAKDALRVVNLSFALLGGADAAIRYFAAHGEPPYVALIYFTLGEHLLDKKRYTDSAQTYRSFVDTHPGDELAPLFLTHAMAALNRGGFVDLVVEEKERYAQHFDPAAAYWSGRPATPEVLKDLRAHLEDLGRHYHAHGQATRKQNPAKARAAFQAAAGWYLRLLELYPQDPKAAELRFLLGESLLETGQMLAAAQEYDKVVRDYPRYEKAPEAAYAALLAYQRYAADVPESQKAAALRQSIQAGLQLAERFPQHPMALAALTRGAEDLYRLDEWDEAIKVAESVLKARPAAPDALRRTAWSVIADAHFSQKRYPQAEIAYTELLKLTPAKSAERKPIGERLGSAIYKQGEAARAAGDHRAAAVAFLRVGRAAPSASIRASADYDASAMWVATQDWTQAAAVLEAFRATYPVSALLPEVDKKLAVVYENAGKPKQSAAVLRRIEARQSESPETRRDAAWLAVTLLDRARDPQIAAAYEGYVQQHPRPLDRAVEARQKLADFAVAAGDESRRLHWLREIVTADGRAGSERTERTRLLAAQATLELGRNDAQKAAKTPLKLPLGKSLPVKKQAMERALATLSRAIEYGVAGIATAATFELGVLYQDFSLSLLRSERPQRLSKLEREQYDLLLEEQAFPFEELAIHWHEVNLQRVSQGIYNAWIGRSMQALTQLVPGRYGKHEQTAEVYDLPAPPAVTPPTDGGITDTSEISGVPATPALTPPDPVTSPIPQERLAHVVRLLNSNQFRAAEAELMIFVKDRPELTGPHTNLGIVYARTERWADARLEFAKAVASDLNNAIAHNWLGVLARQAGNYQRAEASYREALAADPGYAAAQLNLAFLYDQYLKRPADALAAYRSFNEMTGKKDVRVAVWAAELDRAPATTKTPAAASTVAP